MTDQQTNIDPSGTGDFRWRLWVGSALALFCLLCTLSLLLPDSNDAPRGVDPHDESILRERGAWGFHPTAFSAKDIEVLADGYVSSKSCLECHKSEYESWHASYHHTMTQAVSPQTAPEVLRNSTVRVAGNDYKFEQEGDDFWIEMDDMLLALKGGRLRRIKRRIVLMTGSHHMHIFWYETKTVTGNLGMLPVVYLIKQERWIPRSSAFLIPPGHEGGLETGRWNASCCTCHTTHPRQRQRPGYDSPRWDTQVVEFGIACESCHGPGADHVAFHKKKDVAPQQDPIVNPKTLDARRASQVCGQCHTVLPEHTSKDYVEHGRSFRPGQAYEKPRLLPTTRFKDTSLKARPGFFWSDGMIRIAGREFNGLIESSCFKHGTMSCLSCHSLHGSKGHASTKDWADDQLQVGMRGNKACLQCHAEFSDNIPAHTHHAEKSTGSLCMNCHMPHTTYGLLKAIRSHQIDSPRVATGVQTGRITACNQCHLDRTQKWTAEYLTKWYNHEKLDLDEDRQRKAVSVLHSLKGDAGQRALAAWSFGWQPARDASGTDWMTPYLLTLMDDDYDAVRLIAFRSLRMQPGYKNFAFDEFADPAERARITTQAREAWDRKNKDRQGRLRPQLLLNGNGRLNRPEYTRLLKERNNRPVALTE